MNALVFGEALLDCFPDRRVVAGAPLHVAVHLAARGWDVALLTRVGDDEDGRRVRRVLEERRVDTGLVETDPERPTGTVTIELRGAEPSFTIHGPAAWDAIEGPREFPPHDLLVFGSLAARRARSRETLRRLLARASDAFTVFDVNLRPPDVDADVLRMGLHRAHLLKANADELGAVGGLLGLAPGPPAWFKDAPALRWLCVTRGGEGAELFGRDGRVFEAPGADRAVKGGSGGSLVVDTVGAGDAFTAGLADGLARGRAPRDALDEARACAASVLVCRGGLPPNQGKSFGSSGVKSSAFPPSDSAW